MSNCTSIAALGFSGALLLSFASTLSAQATPSAAMCLPAAGGTAAPCTPARPGQTIRLLVSSTSLPTGPITLLFAGQSGARVRTTLPPAVSLDGGYDVPVPAELCSGTRGPATFDVQHLETEVNREYGSGPSLGTLTVAC